jgi:methylated-DNA-protein-cysteine methyltransferase-like protein
LDRISWRFKKKRLIMMIKKRVQKTKDTGFFGGRGGLVFRFLGAATIHIIGQMRPGVNAGCVDYIGLPRYNTGMKALQESTLRILAAIRSVPAGRVSCYRDIGYAAGLPNGARQVARILHSMGETEKLPWHRIVKADGHVALREGQGRELQIELLRAEGVQVGKAGVVDPRCMFRP